MVLLNFNEASQKGLKVEPRVCNGWLQTRWSIPKGIESDTRHYEERTVNLWEASQKGLKGDEYLMLQNLAQMLEASQKGLKAVYKCVTP